MTAWSRERPTEPGWYWWRTVSITPSKTVKIQVVQIGDGGYCWQEGEYTSNLGGEWQGPLTPNEATE